MLCEHLRGRLCGESCCLKPLLKHGLKADDAKHAPGACQLLISLKRSGALLVSSHFFVLSQRLNFFCNVNISAASTNVFARYLLRLLVFPTLFIRFFQASCLITAVRFEFPTNKNHFAIPIFNMIVVVNMEPTKGTDFSKLKYTFYFSCSAVYFSKASIAFCTAWLMLPKCRRLK